MSELIALVVVVVLLIVLFYGLGMVIVFLGAVGWYLSYPVLGIITVLLVALPVIRYRRMVRRSYPVWRLWYEEGDVIVLVGFALLIIWGCALRDQIAALWDSISPYVLR